MEALKAGVLEPGFDDSKWKSTDWFEEPPRPNKIRWLRRSLTLSPTQAAMATTLSLARPNDFHVVYLNGKNVGEGRNKECVFDLPPGSFQPGANQITVRLASRWTPPVVNGDPDHVFLRSPDGSFSLSLVDGWKCSDSMEPLLPEFLPLTDIPSCLFNGMIHPLLQSPVKGVIWYQGEQNLGNADAYAKRFPAMIRDWREHYKQDAMPFYFVQLANLGAPSDLPANDPWPLLREAQAKALALPATGMATAFDIGEALDIHPKNKQDVGHRLALQALAKTYGKPIECHGPVYLRSAAQGSSLIVHFTHADGLKTTDGTPPKGFSIAGENRVFHRATAAIDGTSVVLTSDKVPSPIAVRHAFADNPITNLRNASNLLAYPFRFESGTGNTLVIGNIALPGFPADPGNQLVLNPGFEILPFPTSWTNNGAVTFAGLNGSTTAARLSFNTTASIIQTLPTSTPDFTADASFQIAGNNTEQAFRWQLDAAGSTAVDLRTATGGVLQINSTETWIALFHLTSAATFAVPANATVKIRVIGRDFGSPSASYDISWSDPGSSVNVSVALSGLDLESDGSPKAATVGSPETSSPLLNSGNGSGTSGPSVPFIARIAPHILTTPGDTPSGDFASSIFGASGRTPDPSPAYVGARSAAGVVTLRVDQTITRTATGVTVVSRLASPGSGGTPDTIYLISTFTDATPNNNGVLNGSTQTAGINHSPRYDAVGFVLSGDYLDSANTSSVQFENVAITYTPGADAALQTIAFDAPADRPFTPSLIELSALASSGLPVAFEVVSGPATLSGSTLTLTGTGAINLRATQGGDYAYLPAPPVEQSFTVIEASALENWRFTHFETYENTGDAADLADTDSDGIANLMEFALGLDPKQASTVPATLDVEGNVMAYTLTRLKAAVAEIDFTVEHSDSLLPNIWTKANVEQVSPALADDGTLETIRFNIPATGERRFIRLKVSAKTPSP